MAEQATNLRALEALLDEFFSPSTGNTRKQEIEKVLGNFRSQPTAWRDCLYFLCNSSNHYVSMFSLTTLETFIHCRWVGMLGADRAEIRTNLNTFLFQHHASAPPFIRNKLIKLIVDIARSDWPHFYPEFFTHILSLVHGQETTILGLAMLLTASEELATPREDISTGRAAELRKLMTAQVSHVSIALTSLLETVLELDTQSRTPPPSPSVSNDSEDSVNSMDGPVSSLSSRPSSSASPLHTNSLLHAASLKVMSNSRKSSPVAPPVLDQASRSVAQSCLQCLAHIFTWAPLQTVVSSRLIHVLFQYASLTIRSQGSDESFAELSVLALAAINEIIYKSYVPTDLTNYLLILFKNSFHTLQSLVGDHAPASLITRLPDSFLEKMTEFLRLFVSCHLQRCGEHAQFPLLEFLALVYKFTFQQPRLAGFLACIEVWTCVCDYLQGSVEAGRSEVLARYSEALLALATELLRRIQHRHHGSLLQELDRDSVGDDGNTEWQIFLNTVLELVMRVAELMSEEILRLADSTWREASTSYLRLEQEIDEGHGLRQLRQTLNKEQLIPLLRDYSSLMQLCGRLSSMFIGHQFTSKLNAGLETVKQLLQLASTGSRLKLWSLAGLEASLTRAFVECQASTLAALQAWCHWLAALHSESLQDSSYTWLCSDLTSRIVVAVVAALRDGSSRELTHSAAHFLVTLTGTVRPPSIWKLKEFTDLYSSVPRGQLSLSPESHRLVVRALSNVLLLHWPGIMEQKWEDRRKHLTKFLRDLTEGFRSLKSTPDFATSRSLQLSAEPLIIHTLQMLGDLVENILNEVTQSKKLCHDVTRDYIEITLWLFPLYVQSPKVCEEMFHFFHIVFDVLKAQMGSEFVEQAVQTFFSLFGQNLLSEVITQKKATLESRVVEKFLSILTFIVSEPGSSFRKFVSSTLSLCLDNIFPLIVEHESSDLKAPLYNLLHHTLIHNWNYFFKPSLAVTSLTQLNRNSNQTEVVQNREVFLALMRAIGQSFLQEDIAVFSQNVSTLELLNSKWRLYSKQIFKEALLAEFLSVFIRVLISKSHNLLKEDIGCAVYHMASTDLSAFYTKFLPSLLGGVEGLDDSQRGCLATSFKAEADMPTFLTNLDRFVTDIRYYQLVNASVAQPSIKF